MKEVTKERTHVEKYSVYEATDGTQFDFKEDCEKYEKSALGVLRGRLQKLIVGRAENAWELLGGSDEDEVIAVKPEKETDIDLILHWYYLENPHYLNDNCKKYKDELEHIVTTAYNTKDIILFGLNVDGNFYIINSRQNIINNLNTIDKK